MNKLIIAGLFFAAMQATAAHAGADAEEQVFRACVSAGATYGMSDGDILIECNRSRAERLKKEERAKAERAKTEHDKTCYAIQIGDLWSAANFKDSCFGKILWCNTTKTRYNEHRQCGYNMSTGPLVYFEYDSDHQMRVTAIQN
jgi:hypothetical protein